LPVRNIPLPFEPEQTSHTAEATETHASPSTILHSS
jgi:hypothetical protein